jgi:hypothetical protein
MADVISMVVTVQHDESSAERIVGIATRLRNELLAEEAVQRIEPILDTTKSTQSTKSAALAAVVGAFKAVMETRAAASVVTNVWQAFKGRKIDIEFEKNGTKLKATVSNKEELLAVIETLNKLN